MAEITSDDEQAVSRAEIARRLDKRTQTVRDWIAAGCPVVRRQGKRTWLRESEVRAWLERTGRTGRAGRPSDMELAQRAAAEAGATDRDAEPLAVQKARATIRKEEALAEKHELEVKRRRGELIPRDDVERRWLARVEIVGAGLLSLPAKVAARLAHRPPEEIEADLTKEVRDLLSQFSEEWPE